MARPPASIRLHALGAVELTGGQEPDAGAILQQPRRLALLVYLALAEPRGFHRRDRLLSLFWPEHDSSRGRHALSQAVYVLRRTLGKESIISRGYEEIALAPGALWCDVHAFEEAVGAGRASDALAFYRGDLLSAFFTSGAPGFEEWVETERPRLRRRATQAAWDLAEQREREGDSPAAAALAHQAVALSSDEEDSVRQLISLLDRGGDRGAALRAFDDFARRLSEEYGIAPSQQTVELIERVRSGKEERQGRTVPAAGRVRVAVFPFTVRGTDGYPGLGEGLADLLSANLDGAGELRSVDAHAAIGLAEREGQGGLDVERARVLAERLGARLFVLGSVLGTGPRLRMHASLYDPGRSLEPVVTATAAGGADHALEVANDLTTQLLAERFRGPGGRLTRLALRTTRSLPALKAYLEGHVEFRAGRFPRAVEAFQRSVDEDPAFALGFYQLARTALWATDFRLARVAAKRAAQQGAGLTERDRQIVGVIVASLHGQTAEAERLCRALVEATPDDPGAWSHLGDILFHHDPLRARPLTEGRAALDRALSIDPGHEQALVKRIILAAKEQDHAGLERHLDELAAHGELPLRWRVLRSFTLGEPAEQETSLRELAGAPVEEQMVCVWRVAMLARDLDSAARVVAPLTGAAHSEETRALGYLMRAQLDLAGGRWSAARAAMASASALEPARGTVFAALAELLPGAPSGRHGLEEARERLRVWDAADVPPSTGSTGYHTAWDGSYPWVRRYLLGLIEARLHRGAEALGHARWLAARQDDDRFGTLRHDFALSVRAEAARDEGRPDEALRLLEQIRAQVPMGDFFAAPFFSEGFERFARATLLVALGRPRDALRWYASFEDHYSLFELPYLAHAHLCRAHIHMELDERDLADRNYRRVVELWKGSDPELRPRREEAEQGLTRLRTRPRARAGGAG